MAKYSVLITSTPDAGDAIRRALAFIHGVYSNGDSVANVFFYHQGIHHANRYFVSVSNNRNTAALWASIQTQYDLNLIVCTTAANKRVAYWTTKKHRVQDLHKATLPTILINQG